MKRHIKRVIGHPLFSGSAIMIVGSNGANAINYLYHLVIGRLLGPIQYGELVSLISIMGLLGIIPGAISLVVVKQISSTKNQSETQAFIRWFKDRLFITSLIFSVVVLFSSQFISSFLHLSQFSSLLFVALFSFFSLQSGFNRSILQGLLKFKQMVISILAENGIKLVLSILLFYIGFKFEGVLGGILISAFLGLYFTNYFLREHTSEKKYTSPDIKPILWFTVPVLIQAIATTSLYTTDIILVKHFFSSYDAGIYAALSTLGKIIFFATGPINIVMFPLVSQRKARGEESRRIFLYSFLTTGLFTLVSLILYWLFPRLVIELLYGSAYLGVSNLLAWFAIFISLFTLSTLLINYNLSIGKNGVIFMPALAALIQIIMIFLFHFSLFIVILISIGVTALLLLSLLIYSSYEKILF